MKKTCPAMPVFVKVAGQGLSESKKKGCIMQPFFCNHLIMIIVPELELPEVL